MRVVIVNNPENSLMQLSIRSYLEQVYSFRSIRYNLPRGNCKIFALSQVWPQLGKLLFGYNMANVLDVA